MERLTKQKQICYLGEVFDGAKSIVLTDINGLNARQISELRCKLYTNHIHIKVVKNKLAKIASRNTEVEILKNDLSNMTAVVWSDDASILLSKLLVNFQKDNKMFQIKTGLFFGKKLTSEDIKSVAALPTLEILRMHVLRVLSVIPVKLLIQIISPAQAVLALLKEKPCSKETNF